MNESWASTNCIQVFIGWRSGSILRVNTGHPQPFEPIDFSGLNLWVSILRNLWVSILRIICGCPYCAPDLIANHELLQGVDLEPTGVPTRSGILVTGSLLFVAEGNGAADAGPYMRAVDKETGEIITVIELPNNQTGLPFTYEHDGKQYLALFVGGGGGTPAELVAYALP